MTAEKSSEEAYRHINEVIAPAVLDFFRFKQVDYTGGPAFLLLGSKGQFSDINRKFWKLYKSVWNGEALTGEQSSEIAMDMIGHLLLLLYVLEMEKNNE